LLLIRRDASEPLPEMLTKAAGDIIEVKLVELLARRGGSTRLKSSWMTRVAALYLCCCPPIII
jgi:hypothetical protein